MRILASAFVLVVLALTLGLYLTRSRSRGAEAMAAQPTAAVSAATGNEAPEVLVVPEPEETLEPAPEPAEFTLPPVTGSREEFELRYAGKSLDELRQAQARVHSAIEQAAKRSIDQLEAQGRFEIYPYNEGKVEFDPPLTLGAGEILTTRSARDLQGNREMHVYRYFPADFPELAALQAEAEWLKAKTGTK